MGSKLHGGPCDRDQLLPGGFPIPARESPRGRHEVWTLECEETRRFSRHHSRSEPSARDDTDTPLTPADGSPGVCQGVVNTGVAEVGSGVAEGSAFRALLPRALRDLNRTF